MAIYIRDDGRRFIRSGETREPQPGEYFDLGSGRVYLVGEQNGLLHPGDRAYILQEVAAGKPLVYGGQRFCLTGERRLPNRNEWFISDSGSFNPIHKASYDFCPDEYTYEIVVPEGEQRYDGLRILFSQDGTRKFIPTGRFLKPLRGEWYMNSHGQITQATRGFKNDAYEIMSPISCEE
jgi:hypothetical protein